ncbi:MAG: YceI family protein [Crocinitomicaceae bacterium]|nr:YceI family protein [Crocinitomicaceae bacterium]
MMKYTLLGCAFALSLGLTSCSGSDKADETPTEEAAACFYSYNPGTTVLEWASYKFTEKKAVKGTFTSIEATGLTESDDPISILMGMTLTMKTESVESQDPSRNEKISRLFFGTIGAKEITAKIKMLGDNGKATLEISLGGMTGELEGDYTFEDNVFTFDAAMDVANWNAQNGIDALNAECKDLHTGPDGVSKLWSEVGLHFSTTLKSDCK